jgi:hypothetical protein
MAFPTDTLTGTDLAVFIPEIWGDKINDFAKDVQVLSKFVTDRSYELAGGGDTIYTPGLTEMSGTSKTVATAVTLNDPTETSVTLTVDNWYEVSFAIEDQEAVQYKQSYYIQNRYAENAGHTAGNLLEDAIIDLIPSFTSSVGGSTSVVLESDIYKALGLVEDAAKEEVDNGNYAFFFDRKVFWNQVATLDLFQLNANTPTADPLMKKPAKYIHNVPVYVSSRIDYVDGTTGRYNTLLHRDAIHIATGQLPGQGAGMVRIQSNYVPQYLSTVTTADILYGVVMNRATYGVKFITSASA